MIVESRCIFNGNTYQMDIPLTKEELDECMNKWKAGAFIQEAFHMLNADQREFILTGTPPEVWDEMFKGEENVQAN